MNRILVIAIFLLTALGGGCALANLLNKSAEPIVKSAGSVEPDSPGQEQPALPVTDPVRVTASTQGQRTSAMRSASEVHGPVRVKGRLVSGATGSPIAGMVEHRGVHWKVLEDGIFVFSLVKPSFPIQIVLSAPSFDTREIVLDENQLLEGLGDVGLDGGRRAEILVLRDYEPFSNVAVYGIRSRPRTLGGDVEFLLGTTNSHGILLTHLAGRNTWVFAGDGDWVSDCVPVFATEAGLPLTLDCVSAPQPFAKASIPIAAPVKLEFELKGRENTLKLLRTISKAGTLNLPLPIGVYAVSSRSVEGRIVAVSPGKRQGFRSEWIMGCADGGPATEIQIDLVAVPSLHLLSSTTGDPITSGAAWFEVHESGSWQMWRGDTVTERVAPDGVLALPFLHRLRVDSSMQMRLTVWARGYQPTHLVVGADWILSSDTLEVTLTPQFESFNLLVSQSNGEPYPYLVEIRSEGVLAPLFHGTPSPDGNVESLPVPSDGNSLTLSAGVGHVLEISRGDIDAGGVAHIVIPTGSLRALVSGEQAEIVCWDRHMRLVPGRHENDSWIYSALPSGAYYVGPRALRNNVSMGASRGLENGWVRVEAGTQADIDLRHIRRGPDIIEGRVDVVGVAPETLAIRPIYAARGTALTGGNLTRRHFLNRDGSYALLDLPIFPSALGVYHTTQGGDDLFLDVVDVGTRANVMCGWVEFTLESVPLGAAQEFSVQWAPQHEEYQMVDVHQWKGKVGDPLRIGPLPVGTNLMQIHGDDIYDRVNAEIRAGEVVELKRRY